jgi:hypothetical protein
VEQALNRLGALRTDQPPEGRHDLLLGRLAPNDKPGNGNGD